MSAQKFYALGRLPAGVMNNTEKKYSDLLEARKLAGEILWYKFEAIRLNLANNTSYTPDFVVMNSDRTIELHEVKGFWRDDARVKIKVAADKFPFFKFISAIPNPKKHGGGWKVEHFPEGVF